MRGIWGTLCIITLFAGLFFPPFWFFSLVFLVLAVVSRPLGYRPDGKRETGGLLGGAWDSAVIALTMRDCPFCKAKVPRDAKKCKHCAEWLPENDP